MRRILILASLLGGCTAGGGSPLPGVVSWNPVTGSQLASDADLADTTTASFDQLVDHTDPTNQQTFPQRYFINDSQANGVSAPVFFYVCGEGGCDATAMNVSLKAFAQRYHGHMIALEHRYYGTSFPVSDLTTGNMQYLSASQAIEDAAAFVKSMQQTRQLTGPWVAVGGSYSGSLAAYLRALHPELVIGAVASSAPVQPEELFVQYDETVTQTLGASCAAATRALVQQLDGQAGSAAGPLGAALDYDQGTDARTVSLALGDLASSVAQYNFHMSDFCQAVQSSDPAPGITQVQQAYDQGFKSFNSASTSSTVIPTDPSFVGGRSWEWQTCTEFGFYQVASQDPSQNVFSQFDDVNLYTGSCQSDFGIQGTPDTSKASQAYYAPTQRATRIVYTNGSLDPWTALSVTTDAPQQEIYTQIVQGGSHCSDLGPPDASDSPSLAAAKQREADLVGQWLTEAGGPATGGGVPSAVAGGTVPSSSVLGGAGTTVPGAVPSFPGTLSTDLWLALSGQGSLVSLYVAGDPSLTAIGLCLGDLTSCVSSPVAQVSFTAQAAGTSPLLGRSLFVSTSTVQLASGSPVTLLGFDASGQLTAARSVQFAPQ